MSEHEAIWLHRALLRCYPRAFRREFGAQVLAFWAAQRHETIYSTPLVGALRYWFDVARDAVGSGLRQRRHPQLAPGVEIGKASRPTPISADKSPWLPTRLDLLLQDLRYARRTLFRQPLFTVVAIITLAVGIGSTTAVFSIVDTVLFRPLPYGDPHELVRVGRLSSTNEMRSLAKPEIEALQELDTFVAVAPALEYGTDVQWDDRGEVLNGATVSHDFFAVLGVEPVLGRAFAPDEDVPGGPAVAMISARLWNRQFAGESAALGATLSLQGVPHTIVGVVPGGITFPEPGIDFYIPYRDAQLVRSLDLNPDTRNLVFFDAVARLRPGVSLEAAQADVQALYRRLNLEEEREEDEFRGWAESMHEATVGSSRTGLMLFLGAVGLVFVISCANVAGLWLTRIAGRGTEVAVRTALGAGRRRIVTQLLTESLVLAGLGAAAGVGLAYGLLRGLLIIIPTDIPRLDEVGIDARVVLFAVGLAAVSAIVFGALPALRAANRDSADILREGGRGTVAGRTAGQRALVVGQVAIAVVLLAGAGLFANSYARLANVDLGVRQNGLAVARLSPTIVDGNTDALRAFYAQVLERVGALPGVDSVALTYSPPMGDSNFRQSVHTETMDLEEEGVWAGNVIISPGYLEVAGVSLLRGRAFNDGDVFGAPNVVLVNEKLAAELWPGEDPLGKRFRWARGLAGSLDSFEEEFFPQDWMTVVGVVGDVRRRSPAEEPIGEFYRPHAQMSWPSMALVVSTNGDNPNLATDLRGAVGEIDRMVPISDVQTLRQVVATSIAEHRFRVILVGGFAVTACLLAMLGVYAVMALNVARRTHDIGIRMALGAESGGVLRQVVGDGMRLAIVGATIGVVIALASSRLIATMLFGVAPTDPLTFAGVLALTLLVAAAACYLPARRAARLDPLVALRSD